jgi:hypothetical protein
MRYPGESAAGRAPGRRQSPSPETRPAATGARAGGKASQASLFAPGYAGGRAPDHAPAEDGRWYDPAGGAAGKGPVQGFAPAPGQPPPLYPPGQFAAWNRAPAQDGNGYDLPASGPITDAWPASAGTGHPTAWYADAGYGDTGYADAGYADAGHLDQGHPELGYAGPDSAERGYHAPAVNHPSPDVTSAPGWGAADDTSVTSSWGDLSAGLAGPELAEAGPAGPGLSHPDTEADRAATDPNQRSATGAFDRAATDPNQRAATGPNQRATGPYDRAATGPFDRATPAPFNRGTTAPTRGTTAPTQRVASRPGTGPGPAQAPGRGPGTRGRGSRGRKRRRRSGGRVRVLLACGLVLIVVAGAAYFLLSRGHKSPSPAADSQRTTGARSSPNSPSPSPSPSLGPWGHIQSRALDPVPLTLTELFPASFSDDGVSYVMTASKAKVHCAGALAGSQLTTAVGRAGCTQAMRASYLSSDKLMGTIGVLNLVTANAAEQAGKAAGPSEFIAQLPAASGPTKNLTKGTGFEAAEVKGHYLVLVWAEFVDLNAPGSPARRAQLEDFISLLMQKTANVSLATRQVTGSPPP